MIMNAVYFRAFLSVRRYIYIYTCAHYDFNPNPAAVTRPISGGKHTAGPVRGEVGGGGVGRSAGLYCHCIERCRKYTTVDIVSRY